MLLKLASISALRAACGVEARHESESKALLGTAAGRGSGF